MHKSIYSNMPHGTVWYPSPQPWCAAFKQTCCVTRGVIFIISMSSNNFAIYLSCAKTSHEQYKPVGVPYPHKVFDNNCTQHLKACTCRPLIINQLTYQVFATVPQPTNTVLCAVVLFFAFTSFAGINSLV